MPQFHDAPHQYLEVMREHLPLYDRIQEEVARASGGLTVHRILDLGAGTGQTSARCLAIHPAAKVVAVDSSDRMLSIAAGVLGDRVEPRRARLQDPLPPGPFELVVSALAVHHLDVGEKAELFRRVRDCLAPGGRFVMADVIVPDAPVAHPTPLDPAEDKPDRLDDLVASISSAGLDPRTTWAEQDLVVIAASHAVDAARDAGVTSLRG